MIVVPGKAEGRRARPRIQHLTIRLEQRVELPRVEPSTHLDRLDPRTVVDHVLERIGEIVLALVGRLGEHVIDAFEEQPPIADEVEADIRLPGDRRGRLLDDARHEAVGVRHHDAEALVVLDLLGPDDAVGVGAIDDRQIGVEDRIDEDDEDRLIDVGTGERDRTGRTVLYLLLDEDRSHIEGASGVLLDFLLEMARDVDDLLDVAKFSEVIEDVRHHRLPGNAHHRLRHDVRVWPEPRALAGERDDDLHGALVPARP